METLTWGYSRGGATREEVKIVLWYVSLERKANSRWLTTSPHLIEVIIRYVQERTQKRDEVGNKLKKLDVIPFDIIIKRPGEAFTFDTSRRKLDFQNALKVKFHCITGKRLDFTEGTFNDLVTIKDI
jgi:hypothetical protein